MEYGKIKDLKNKVLFILEHYRESRDSDQWLTLKLWCVYYPSRIKEDEKGKKYVYLTDVLHLPREDNVKRIRAIIQNEEKKFLPTSLEVAKQRKINEADWYSYIKLQDQLFK
jgi:hypothetical protein